MSDTEHDSAIDVRLLSRPRLPRELPGSRSLPSSLYPGLSIDTSNQAQILEPGIHLLLPVMAAQLTECDRILDVSG